MTSDKTLDELRLAMTEQDDGHVMIQSLRQVPLLENSLERDKQFCYYPAPNPWAKK